MDGKQADIEEVLGALEGVGNIVSEIETITGTLYENVDIPDELYVEDDETGEISIDEDEGEMFLQGLDLMEMEDQLDKIITLAEEAKHEINEAMRYRNPYLG